MGSLFFSLITRLKDCEGPEVFPLMDPMTSACKAFAEAVLALLQTPLVRLS